MNRLRGGAVAVLASGALALVLAGCGSGDGGEAGAGLSVDGAYMPQPVSDSLAAGFLTVTNDGGDDDTLESVTSDIAGQVTVHETVGQSMREVDGLNVPAHGKLVLESGGNHLMFEQLKRKPKEGETVSVVLHFAHTDPVTVEMPVKPMTYRPASGN
ncbi:copper chaperone PCu(A)C [Streptomyces sp. B93]|nr:copper chaperone PCu(A)C [Streptomyces sp. B93]MBQ1091786.1 copper chaperone PCu(A)C [Streptomyces sp. B93]